MLRYTHILLLLAMPLFAVSFTAVSIPTRNSASCRVPATSALQAIPPSADGRDDKLDALRRMLESSWNADTMGTVPSDAASAAEEAVAAIRACPTNICFVNLLLPSYDITLGDNMYDEVVAVEYCMELSRALSSRKSLILVREDSTVQLVNRVMDRRRRDLQDRLVGHSSDDEGRDEEKDSVDDTEAASDTDAFRKKLMQTWESDGDDDDDDSGTTDFPSVPELRQPPKQDDLRASIAVNSNSRLSSLFGAETIAATGKQVITNVLQAVQKHALPDDDEDTIIILSAVSREEMIAIRILAGKYAASKRIVLVNCHNLSPLPKELANAETAYSVMPLLAQPTVSETNLFGDNDEARKQTPPRVVVMRRYPRDWEVYVDIGDGFELADSKAARQVPMVGPPMDWVAGVVKRFMQSKV